MATEVNIDDLENAIAEGKFVVDVREDHEFEAGHVPNAHHIPLSTVADRSAELPQGEQIWLICQGGVRSMKAADYLLAQGFDVVSVAGGTGAWIAAGKVVSFEASK
jgi:rhodanese-related sulfurtransferase